MSLLPPPDRGAAAGFAFGFGFGFGFFSTVKAPDAAFSTATPAFEVAPASTVMTTFAA